MTMPAAESAKTGIDDVIHELDRQSTDPPTINDVPDTYIAHFSGAMATRLKSDPLARETLERSLFEKQRRGPVSRAYAANFLLRLCQMEWMHDQGYPYEDRDKWAAKVDELFDDPKKSSELGINMIIWNVGSDVETRIAGPKLVAATLDAERSQSGDYRVLSVGSARDHGLAMWQSGLAFPHVSSDDHEADINQILNEPLPLGAGIGVDLWPLRDQEWKRFLGACRFYPSELLCPEKRQRYGYLEGIRDATPTLYHIDIDFGEDKVDDHQGGIVPSEFLQDNSLDMVIFSTSLYQNFPRKRERMIADSIRLLRTSGLVVVQEFCRTVPAAADDKTYTSTLDFETSWYADKSRKATDIHAQFPYATTVMRKNQTSEGFQEFALWQDGRCEKMHLGKLLRSALEQ